MERLVAGNFAYSAEPPRTAVTPTVLEMSVSELAEPSRSSSGFFPCTHHGTCSFCVAWPLYQQDLGHWQITANLNKLEPPTP